MEMPGFERARLYRFLQQKRPRTVRTGLRGSFLESRFPTLKRGANKRCAYGAVARTLLMQFSVAAPNDCHPKDAALADEGRFTVERICPQGLSPTLIQLPF